MNSFSLGPAARMNPMRAILAGCCARAASGHAATAPPRSVMNVAPFYLTELHLTLDEPGLRRKYIQLMRSSQEVAERFYTV